MVESDAILFCRYYAIDGYCTYAEPMPTNEVCIGSEYCDIYKANVIIKEAQS